MFSYDLLRSLPYARAKKIPFYIYVENYVMLNLAVGYRDHIDTDYLLLRNITDVWTTAETLILYGILKQIPMKIISS